MTAGKPAQLASLKDERSALAAMELAGSYWRAGPQLTARDLPSSGDSGPGAAAVVTPPASAVAASPEEGAVAPATALAVSRSGGRLGSEPDLHQSQGSVAPTGLQPRLGNLLCVHTRLIGHHSSLISVAHYMIVSSDLARPALMVGWTVDAQRIAGRCRWHAGGRVCWGPPPLTGLQVLAVRLLLLPLLLLLIRLPVLPQGLLGWHS